MELQPKPKRKPLYAKPKSKREAVMAFRTDLDYMDHDEAKEAFQEVADLLDTIGSPFFLIQGTALGAYRDGGFTPNDNDIDFGMLWENFVQHIPAIASGLIAIDFEVRTVNRPFTRPRILNAIRNTVKIDIVSYIPYKDKRFCTSTILPYSVVHEADILEPPYDSVGLFNREVLIPSPIEDYLRLEYNEWKIPKNDSVSKTRVENFLTVEGINRDYLKKF